MKVALGQFAVGRTWQENAQTAIRLMAEAEAGGAALLVLPEGVLARDIADPDIVLNSAQPLDGPFVSALAAASRGKTVATMMCIHVPAGPGRVYNMLVTLRDGELVGAYRKLHLYDAFDMRESDRVAAGAALPAILDIGSFRVAPMTCYDLRFPELARRLVLDGAELLAVPAAWVRGPNKEAHWQVLARARALENTCYLVGVGECGPRNIGASLAVDPLGIVTVQAGETPALLFAGIDRQRLEEARRQLPVLAHRRFDRPELRADTGPR